MKTSKIILTLATLNLVLFMSVSSIAKPVTNYEGDIINSGVKKQLEAVKSTMSKITSNVTSGNDFNHLRFDVNKFNADTEVAELPLNSMDYLRFDANNFSEGIASGITELPTRNQFDYLRFDVTNFNNTCDLSEMPFNEFDYLRFDMNKYSGETSVTLDELPNK